MLGKKPKLDNSRLLNVLKIEQVPISKTVVDMAYSLIERKLIKVKN